MATATRVFFPPAAPQPKTQTAQPTSSSMLLTTVSARFARRWYYTTLCYTGLYWTIRHSTTLDYILLHYTALDYTLLYSTMLYSATLHCTLLSHPPTSIQPATPKPPKKNNQKTSALCAPISSIFIAQRRCAASGCRRSIAARARAPTLSFHSLNLFNYKLTWIR